MCSRYSLISTLVGLCLSLSIGAAAEGEDLESALTSGKSNIAIKYRFEHVDQDGFAENADASTARLRLNYRTGRWNGLTAFGEFDHIFHVLIDDFNSGAGTSPSRGQYPVVADPSGSDLNQLYLDYESSAGWKARLGRQRINLDNQRFVGGVGWRQNEQTYDGLTLTTDNIPQTKFSYTYLNYVRRIFGQTVPAGDARLDGHLLNADVTLNEDWSIVPYFYYLDYDDIGSAANSTATLGVRFAGDLKTGYGIVNLFAELATQSDAGNAPISYDAPYAHIGANWNATEELSLGLAYELLGGDLAPGQMFRTPLATLHAFQGWADKFLGTPAQGIEDIYVSAKYRYQKWNFQAIYHDFSASEGSADWGKEIDLSASRSLNDHYSVLLKAAFFNASDAPFTDTNKIWIQLTANY